MTASHTLVPILDSWDSYFVSSIDMGCLELIVILLFDDFAKTCFGHDQSANIWFLILLEHASDRRGSNGEAQLLWWLCLFHE